MVCAVPTLDVQRSSSFTDDLIHNLYDMKSHATMTDFTIKVHDVIIPCHSVVMAAASPYFRVLFNSSMKEVTQKQVQLDSMNEQYLQKVVDYCYNGEITIELDSAHHCLEIVEYFQLVSLKAQIEKFICQHLTPKNSIGWYFHADKYQLMKLKLQSKTLMIAQFPQVIQFKEFLQLTLPELMDYIKEDVATDNGDTVLAAAFRWITFDLEARKASFIDIIPHLQLCKCSPGYMKHVLKCLDKSYPQMDQIQDALIKAIIDSTPDHEYKFKISMIILGGLSSKLKVNSKCWRVDLDSGRSELLGLMPHDVATYFATFCGMSCGIYVSGGSRQHLPLSPTGKCSIYDQSWASLPTRQIPAVGASAVYLNGKVYELGGLNGCETVMECLDLSTKQWSPCPNMLQQGVCPIVGTDGRNIYVVFNTFGENLSFQQGSEVTMQCYDTHTMSWNFRKALPADLANTGGARLVSNDGLLYLVGGEGKLCACYSPLNDFWTVLQKPNKMHRYGSAFFANGQIFLCGGSYKNGTCHDIIEVYDVKQDTWTVSHVKLPEPLEFHICVID